MTILVSLVVSAAVITLLNCAASTRNVNRQQIRTIESYMDQDGDPCVDFYQYACGNWENAHSGADYADTIGLVDFKANEQFTRILKSVRGGGSLYRDNKFVRNTLNYYRSCISIENYEPVKYLNWLRDHEHLKWPAPARNVIKAKRNGNSTDSQWDWLNMLATLRKYGLNGILVEETIMQNRTNSRRSLIDIDKPVLNGGFQPLTFEKLALILEYLGVIARRRVQTVWEDVHVFEVKLMSLDDIDDEEGFRHLKLVELKLPWLERYLSTVMSADVDPQMEITIQNLPYLEALFALLDDYNPKFICRYLMIRFLWYLHVEGPTHFMEIDCVAHTRSMLPLAMHWLYEKHHPELVEQTPQIEALFHKLVQHFNNTVNANANSFEVDVLRFLHAKLEGIQIKVGNLPRPSTAEKLETIYKNLSIDVRYYYANHLKALSLQTHSRHDQVHSLLPETGEAFYFLENPETGASSSPYYVMRTNMVIVPLTLLHTPIYHSQFHDLFKYSSLGFLLAHEITHGFDDSGVQFDRQGNMRGPVDDIKSNTLFDTNLSCLRAKDPQIIDEKIADVSGLRWAYETYFANHTEFQHALRGFKPTPARLFFLNFAQFFCGSTDAVIDDFNEHGPDRQRVSHTLSNFIEFARVFECSLGSPMHPEQKCQLWR